MGRKYLTLAEKKRLIQEYHAGTLSNSIIKELEMLNNTTIQEMVESLEWEMNNRKYNIFSTTITEIKKMIKNQKKLTDEQISLYEKHSNCTFSEVLQIGKDRILGFEEQKEDDEKLKKMSRMDKFYLFNGNYINAFEKLRYILRNHFDKVKTLQASGSAWKADCHFLVSIYEETKVEEFSKDNKAFKKFMDSLEQDLKEQFVEATITMIAPEHQEYQYKPDGNILHIKVKEQELNFQEYI